MEAADFVLRFLESLGRRDEAQFYLNLFRSEPKEQFAAIVVDPNVMRHASSAVALDLHFLAALGLHPTVVFGLYEGKEAREHAARIERKLKREQVHAVVRASDSPTLDADVLADARAGAIPIVTFSPPPTQDGGMVETATSAEARVRRLGDLLSTLRTRKIIFLHRPGGMRQRGSLVPVVNLSIDFDQLASSRELTRKQQAILAVSRRLIFDLCPHPLVAAVTSPLDLLRELFTIKGAGTLLRRGAVLSRHEGWEGIDRERLKTLLVSSFGRVPEDAFFQRPVSRVYLEENYRGAAIMLDTPLGSYLSKFAVERRAQGEGIGGDIWQRLSADHPSIFWRARGTNPISAWYTKICDGMVRFADWHVFWKGLRPDQIPTAVEAALAQPIDLAAESATV